MIVYVESNFVLEIALGQQHAPSAERILALAENGKIQLAFPSFALSEPFASVMQGNSERLRLRNSLEAMLKQLKQSERLEVHRQVVSGLQPVLIIFADIVEKELEVLHSTIDRLLEVGKCIEINVPSFRQALVYRAGYKLSSQDSIIYSAVIADLQQQPREEAKCFLSSDRKAFSTDPDIRSELTALNCKYFGSFLEGLRYIQRYS
jgi:predicted nucleic acid-binding protein